MNYEKIKFVAYKIIKEINPNAKFKFKRGYSNWGKHLIIMTDAKEKAQIVKKLNSSNHFLTKPGGKWTYYLDNMTGETK
jgi:inhibitor of KinA sporulation pathway (predicted exonuclease)